MRKMLVLLLLLSVLNASAQNTIARLKYEQAEEAYNQGDYNAVVNQLQEVEKILGSVNPKILYLRIQAQNKIIETNYSNDVLNELQKNCSYYLTNYENVAGTEEKYKEVYLISENLKQYFRNEDNEKGIQYFNAKDYENALQFFKRAASEGYTTALNWIGYLYNQGLGVQKDYSKAMEWYQRAAAKGNSWAVTNIGTLYENGEGVPQSYNKAMEWYLKGASSGNKVSMRLLGNLHLSGKGVPVDYTKAREWYLKASEKNDISSYNKLGYLYYKGLGESSDYGKALRWFIKGADEGDVEAMEWAGITYWMGFKDSENAFKWLSRAAEKGCRDCFTSIGNIYYSKQKYEEAAEFYKKDAYVNNNVEAMKSIAEIYEKGMGNVKKDKQLAKEWWQKYYAAKK